MRIKRLLLTIFLTLIFIFTSLPIQSITNVITRDKKYTVAYAAPKSSSGGFKSGSFKSSGGSGSYKSGNFFNSKGSSSSGSSGWFKTTPRSSTQRSYIPIPIPLPFFGTRSLFGFGFGYSIAWDLIKIVVIGAVIYIIIRKFRRRY